MESSPTRPHRIPTFQNQGRRPFTFNAKHHRGITQVLIRTATGMSKNLKKMKRIFLAVAAIVLNTFLFSCTTDSLAETDEVYHHQSTEGDDEDPDDPPTGNG